MFNMMDVMPEIYKEFPELDEKSLDVICRTGLVEILKLMRKTEEVNIKCEKQEELKFCFPTSPDIQNELTLRNIRRRKIAALKKQNGEKSN